MLKPLMDSAQGLNWLFSIWRVTLDFSSRVPIYAYCPEISKSVQVLLINYLITLSI